MYNFVIPLCFMRYQRGELGRGWLSGTLSDVRCSFVQNLVLIGRTALLPRQKFVGGLLKQTFVQFLLV